MSTGKKIVVGLGLLAVLLLGGGAYVVFGPPLENHIASELKAAVEGNLNATCTFDSLDYQAPLTVVIKGFRLTADDPDNPGQTIHIFEAEFVEITLADVPDADDPLEIKELRLDGAVCRLIDAKGDAGLIGFSNLFKSKPDADSPPPSEVLQITRIDINDGEVFYDTRSNEVKPMRFTGITTGIDIQEQSPNKYNVDLNLQQGPRFEVQLKSVCDLADSTVGFDQFRLAMSVGRDQDQYLPPQIQQVLKDYNIDGKLTMTGQGLLRATDWKQSDLQAELTLAEGYAMTAGYQLPLDRMEVKARLAESRIDLTRIEADVFSGRVRGDAVIKLDELLLTDIRLGGDKLNLHDTLAAGAEGDGPDYAGLLSFDASAQLPLAKQEKGLNMLGQGTAKVREGRLVSVPVISDIADFMTRRGDAERKPQPGGSDRVDTDFEFRGDHAYVDQFRLVGDWFAMRARGEFGFDGHLRMNVNAGPMQKVQSTLGPIGDVFGAITDGLVAYRVTGTFDDINVSVAPFGGVVGAPGERDQDQDKEEGFSPLNILNR